MVRSLRCGCTGTEQRRENAPVTANYLLGMQGWQHPEWIGSWYSQSIESSAMLGEYAQRFPTVEVDDTFYGIPPEPVVRRWRDSVPAGFSFALKAPQQVTHEQRFAGPGGLLKRFLERISVLEEKLGPVLLLAPIGFEPNDANRAALRVFVNTLPSGFLWALELRHAGWFTEDIFDMFRSKNMAMVIGENRWVRRSSVLKLMNEPTADFAYIRWANRSQTVLSAERSESKDHVSTNWGKTLEGLSSLVKTVYGYFNINAYGNGLRSVEELQCTIGQRWLEASVSGDAAASVGEEAF
jgi:uncharacterized protein YecE (DUF72 family)